MLVKVFTDGGSRGNPGISGYGLVIYGDQKSIIYQESKYLGIKTNNEAEYTGMIAALTWIKDNKIASDIDRLEVFSDSQLMVRQIQGRYKVKAVHLKPLYQSVISLLQQINLPFQFRDVLRESNELADKLANLAMDQK